MKPTWKILFWITLTLLIISNFFWAYQIIDNAVSKGYYEVSCNEYYGDMMELKRILDTKTTKSEALNFLEQYNVEFDSFQKGEEFIITLNSFGMTFNSDGTLILSEQH